MKIYFAGSIRGGREDKELYLEIIKHLQKYGNVLTEHIGNKDLTKLGEDGLIDKWIYDRDMNWLKEADIVIAEVTSPSLGVGYEIATAERLNKRILCLYRPQPQKRLSAMIAGCGNFTVTEYTDLENAKSVLAAFFSKI